MARTTTIDSIIDSLYEDLDEQEKTASANKDNHVSKTDLGKNLLKVAAMLKNSSADADPTLDDLEREISRWIR